MGEPEYDPSAYRHGTSPSGRRNPYLPPEPRGSFFALLPRALSFPVAGSGRMMLLAGAVTFTVTDFIARYSLFGFILSGFVASYLTAYMFKVIRSVAGGDDSPPDWPELTDPVDDLLIPLLLMAGAIAMSFTPLFYYLGRYIEVYYEPVAHVELKHITWFYVTLGFGCLTLPMYMLSAAMLRSFSGLNPVVVAIAAVRTAPAYLTACAALAGAIALRVFLGRVTAGIPFAGSLISWMVSLYFLMAEMYVLGLIYRTNERRLGWFQMQ